MLKVLFVAYLFPPIVNSGTRRSLEFVNRLPEHGWEPLVLTTEPADNDHIDANLLAEVRSDTRIERIRPWVQTLKRSLEQHTGSNRLATAFEWRAQRLSSLPDIAASWRRPAVRHGVALQQREAYDLIYATGWPWTSFLVAKDISKATGVPFVIDYRDLWRPSDAAWDTHTRLQALTQPYFERSVQNKAAEIVTTTESFARLLRAAGASRSITCITNGFNPADFDSVHREAPDRCFCTISYTGVWRPGYGPDDLYRAVAALKQQRHVCLDRLRVRTAGFKPGRAAEMGIDDIVSEAGSVPHHVAVSMMVNADALYLPVSGGLYDRASLPGKLFEYIGSGTPIIASSVPDSEVNRALSHVGGAAIVSPGDIDTLARTIAGLCSDSSGSGFTPRNSTAASHYDRNNQCAALAALFNRVVSRGAS